MPAPTRPLLIFVSGPPGAGKSTFVKILRAHYLLLGYKVHSQAITAFPMLSYTFFKLLSILLYGREIVELHLKLKVHPSTLVIQRVKLFPPLIVYMLSFLEIISILLSFHVKVFLRNKRNTIILIDEGLVNAIANYVEVFGKHAKLLVFFVLEFIKRIHHKFKVKVVFLDTRFDEVLVERWKKRGHPTATSLIGLEHHLMYARFVRLSEKLVSKVTRVVELNADEKPPLSLVKEYVKQNDI